MANIRPTRDEVSDRFPILGFAVQTGGAPYFEVMLTTDPTLPKEQRAVSNFFSTRVAGPLPAERGEAVYLVPAEVLQRFAGAGKLFYGLATFSDPSRHGSDVARVPSAASPYVNLRSYTGRSSRRMQITGRTRPARGGQGYAANPGEALIWSGDQAQPGAEAIAPASSEATAAPAKRNGNGNGHGNGHGMSPSAAPPMTQPSGALDYDDGFGPMPFAEEDEGGGIEGPIPDVAPVSSPQAVARAQAQAPEYPQASRFAPAHPGNYRASTSPRTINRIVIHITDGGAKIDGPISWFQNPQAKVSAHYVIGQDGEVVQMVLHNDVAWHASRANGDSIGIEHVANTKGLLPTEAEYCASAALVSWLCDQFGIPKDRDHIIGHNEADPKTTHSACPTGPKGRPVWDWDSFMHLIETGTCDGTTETIETGDDSVPPEASASGESSPPPADESAQSMSIGSSRRTRRAARPFEEAPDEPGWDDPSELAVDKARRLELPEEIVALVEQFAAAGLPEAELGTCLEELVAMPEPMAAAANLNRPTRALGTDPVKVILPGGIPVSGLQARLLITMLGAQFGIIMGGGNPALVATAVAFFHALPEITNRLNICVGIGEALTGGIGVGGSLGRGVVFAPGHQVGFYASGGVGAGWIKNISGTFQLTIVLGDIHHFKGDAYAVEVSGGIPTPIPGLEVVVGHSVLLEVGPGGRPGKFHGIIAEYGLGAGLHIGPPLELFLQRHRTWATPASLGLSRASTRPPAARGPHQVATAKSLGRPLKPARARPMQAVEIASAIVGAAMTRILDNQGDISWELDQLQGLKHPGNDAANAGGGAYATRTISVEGPKAATVLGLDEIYVNCELTFQYNGHSLGNIQVAVVETNDAVNQGLIVKEQIMDDANAYTHPPATDRFAAVKVRFHYRFTSSTEGDAIAITDLTLYGDGTYSQLHRWTQK